MKTWFTKFISLIGFCLWLVGADAAPLTITIQPPAPPPVPDYFHLGTTNRPDGQNLTTDSRSLRLNGKPWLPVMGEFHYARYPENEWYDELLKMKAGGVDIVSTYVLWIHHEEVEGKFDWSGQRDLRHFVETCKDVGLDVIVRCGPWCHAETRNGGLPDWVMQHKDWKLRSTDTNFLAAVTVLYQEIGSELYRFLWKDGGPVIGIQVDNEYHGSPDYLIALKNIARAAGLDVPFYTRTGWPALNSQAPLGELLPFYGTYPDGFWDRDLIAMGGDKWTRFTFSTQRIDANIANDMFGKLKVSDDDDTAKYPYLTCELGGGTECSYHRRMVMFPEDAESICLLKIGSGVNLPGFYMYHGGVNPEGKLSTYNESRDTGYANDLPVRRYDYESPIGEYGQLRPHYHGLRKQFLFLHDFGEALTAMPVTIPENHPVSRNDFTTLRWAVRSDGSSGYVFVNNYQRLQPLPPKPGVQFKLQLPDGELVFPSQPVTVPADKYFLWPFNLDLGGVKLVSADAQPICNIDDNGMRTVFFAQTPGVPAEFVFNAGEATVTASNGTVKTNGNQIRVTGLKPGHDAAIALKTGSGHQVQIVLLNEHDSLALWKGKWQGTDRVVLSDNGVIFDGDSIRLSGDKPELAFEVLPAPHKILANSKVLSGQPEGVFHCFTLPMSAVKASEVKTKLIQPAGPLRTIVLKGNKQPVAVAPSEADFAQAAVWDIKLPADVDLNHDPMLKLHFVGDVARVTLDGKLLTDDFYNGSDFEVGLRRHGPQILKGELHLVVLPLQKDEPIYLPKAAWPDFKKSKGVARLDGVELVNHYEAGFSILQ